jgi:hypothetical protein
MKRLGLAVAVAMAALAAPAVALADPLALCNGQPCVNGHWYTSTVSVTWNLNGEANLAGCAAQTYKRDTDESNLTPTTPNLPPWTYCTTDVATRYAFISVELSSPTATVAPSRPPDSNGWYNHAVTAAASASSFSGIASCTPTTYAGPDTTAATVAATCVDNAGKIVTVASAPFAYDATPPTLAATANPADQTAWLSWQTGGDIAPIASITVTRSGGSAAPVVVYTGGASGFQDTHLTNGVHYTYTITARDQAGNAATQAVQATPAARLLSPAPNAHVTDPPILSWTPVPNATYYNVQLYRGDPRKVLSLWPAQASLQLKRTWRFDGRRYRLRPGRYRWFVWPGFGKRSAGRYGKRIGAGTFIVVR